MASTRRPEDIVFSGGWIAADPAAVFDRAIALGHLSQDPSHDRYAGDWMYMSHRTLDGRAGFKHKVTRRYLWVNLDPMDASLFAPRGPTPIDCTQSGEACFSAVRLEDGSEELRVFIRQEPHRINRLENDPTIECRAAAVPRDGVYLIPFLFLIGGDFHSVWVDVRDGAGNGQRYLELLGSQERLLFCFFDSAKSPGPARRLSTANPYRVFARGLLQGLERHPRQWTRPEYLAALRRLTAEFPSAQSLWHMIGDAGSDG